MIKKVHYRIFIIACMMLTLNSCMYMLPFMIDGKDKSKESIQTLIRKNRFEDVRVMLSENPSLVNDFEKVTGDTPLSAASYDSVNGPSFIKLLIQHGADPDLRGRNFYDSNAPGKLPLEIALESGSLESVRLLLENGANPDLACSDGQSLVEKAFESSEEIAKAFIEYNAEIKSDTLLYRTITKGYSAELFTALKNSNLNLFCSVENRSTLLHTAARFGRKEILGILVASGLDVNKTDSRGLTPLHHACTGSIRIMQIAGFPNSQEVPVFKASIDAVRHLYFAGASVGSKDNTGETPLHLASKYGYPDIAEFLAGKGADINAVDSMGRNSLHYAAEGITVNIQGSDYKPYHADNPALADFLINKGAAINARDNSGETPLSIAYKVNASKELISLLISRGGR